jgi:hypothetical protein
MTLLSSAPTAPLATGDQGGARPGRLAVPWTTVLTLAVLLDFADGFFMTSLRNAVGAIERTQEPFTSYWRTSLLLVPAFALGVLVALTVALRLFGPQTRSRRQVLATVALVAAAGALVGAAATTASSAADYALQSGQLGMMKSMRATCDASCLAAQQHATFLAHVKAIVIVGALMLVTNLLLVGWLAALRGGALKVSTVRSSTSATDAPGTRGQDARLLVGVGLVAAAAIHAAVVREHLSHWPVAGVAFVLLTVAQLAAAGLLLVRRQRSGLVAAAVVSAAPLVLWLVSRTAGLPIGPDAGTRLGTGLPEDMAVVLEAVTLLGGLALLGAAGWFRRSAIPPHYRALALLAVVTVTVIGLAGAAPGWMDGLTASEAIQHSLIHHS